ncbi:MAG: hypothetical protein ACYTG0_22720 [Planctomycetota bacterium]|jgi:hypothetical protein
MARYALFALAGWICLIARTAPGRQPDGRKEPTAGQPLAWARFEDASFQYAGKPYLWLGHGPLEFSIDVPPRADHALELLWGSKDDTRDAVATIGGHEIQLRSGGYDGFRWLRVPLPHDLASERYEVTLRRGSERPAFIAEVRLMAMHADEADVDLKADLFKITFKAPSAVPGPSAPTVFDEMRAVWDAEPPEPADPLPDDRQEAAFRQAARNARQAAEAFFRCRRFVDGWLAHADPASGLIPRNLSGDRDIWNARDSAADNYPFMVLTAAMTDRPLLEGRMRDMLRTEIRLTSRVDRLPDNWSFSKQAFAVDEPNMKSIIFGSAEYMKDGLIPITEWLGPSPWSERMLGLMDDVWKHAAVPTPYGNIPSTDPEVNGDLLMVLPRLYWMTGEKKHLEYALRLGDYYLLAKQDPTLQAARVRLIAHGGEVFDGLAELYVTVHFAVPEKKKSYQEPLHAMYDRILKLGRNEHGMVYNSIDPRTGQHGKICDTWGYTYNGLYAAYLVDGTSAYREAVQQALGSLQPHYNDYHWGSADEYADSVESALYHFNRQPTASVATWLDSTIRRMWSRQQPDGVIEGWHGDGNNARTSLMYALWKTQGLTVEPWRADVRFGAAMHNDALCISLLADEPWSGRLRFDIPRHRVHLHLPIDYPRLNQFPEWFTVDSAEQYTVEGLPGGRKQISGKQLHDGLAVTLDSGRELRLNVAP